MRAATSMTVISNIEGSFFRNKWRTSITYSCTNKNISLLHNLITKKEADFVNIYNSRHNKLNDTGNPKDIFGLHVISKHREAFFIPREF